MRLILASSSVYRRQLLERLRLPFAVVSPGVDETPLSGEGPRRLSLRLAEEKAAAVWRSQPAPRVVIGSDQGLALGRRMLGKPGTAANARAQLGQLSGREVAFYTALVVIGADGATQRHCDVTRVRFRALSDAEIERYVTLEQPLDCAGSFKSEALGIALVERIRSADPSALIGLPLIETARMLRAAGLNPLG